MPIDLKNEFNKIVQQALERMIKTEFVSESNPYGKKWRKKKIDNGQPQMVDTGALRAGFSYTSQANTTTINNKVSYFAEAADPAKNRMVYPNQLPDNVKKDIDTEIKRFLDKNIKTLIKETK